MSDIFAETGNNISASSQSASSLSGFNFHQLEQTYFIFLIIFIFIDLLLFGIWYYLKLLVKKELQVEGKFYKSQKKSDLARLLLEGDLEKETKKGRNNNIDFKSRLLNVEKYLQSDRYEDWRAAIFEADLLLKELLLRLDVPNGTLGQMLKSLDKSKFKYIEEAWEAHKFRNHLAHSSLDDKQPKSEFERIFKLYKSIFENNYI